MNILRYYRTLKYLKPSQIFHRLIFSCYRPKSNLNPPPSLRQAKNNFIEPIMKRQRLLSENEFMFANKLHDISAHNIWNDSRLDKLWLYNLHYFDEPNPQFIHRWIKENPPAYGIGWEPYPLSLRIVNWIKWVLSSNYADAEGLQSLAIQTRYLTKRLEYHLLGNHLLANAKALVFAGYIFSGAEADRWLNKGLAILQREIPEQILADGGHFERSPMYHAIILEDLLDLINIKQTYGKPVPQLWKEIIPKMLVWLQTMTFKNNEIAFFNDATANIASDLSALKAYVSRLGFEISTTSDTLLYLKESGFCRIEKNNAILIADIGSVKPDYIPGHAHAGTLSFELCIAQQKILTNSGISCYGENSQRYFQRSTAAHNAIVINQQNSSEVWGSFRVGRRARTSDVAVTEINDTMQISAIHDGYRHLSGSPLHRRTWSMQAGKLLIKDEILGSGEHEICQIFHLHPDVQIEQKAEYEWLLKNSGAQAKIILDKTTKVFLENSFYYPEFGKAQPKFTLLTRANFDLPVTLLTLVEWY